MVQHWAATIDTEDKEGVMVGLSMKTLFSDFLH